MFRLVNLVLAALITTAVPLGVEPVAHAATPLKAATLSAEQHGA